MPSSSRILGNGDAHTVEEFIKDLEATSDQVQKLLDEVRESEVDFAAIKTELRILCERVKELSAIIRDGEGGISLLTRLALLEQKFTQLEKILEKHDAGDTKAVEANTAGKWQMKIAVATGVLSLVGTLVHLLFKLINKL